MSYSIPDLTGENPAYKVTNLKKRILAKDQKLEFFDTVYADSIVLTLEGTGTKLTNLIREVDWTVLDDDKDLDAMGRMQLTDPRWDRVLVRTITIIKPFVAAYNINAAYQTVYPQIIDYIRTTPSKNIDFTPEVLSAMITDISNLKVAVSPVTNVHANVGTPPKLLDEDPTCTATENIIVDEECDIDTTSDVNVIHPAAGAFFRDTLIVTSLATGKLLEPDIDYRVFDCDYARTKRSSNTSGVYNFIIFLKAFTGKVKITYHAFGGIATMYDVKAVSENYNNLYKYIADAQLLTADNLTETSAYKMLLAKINAQEAIMRALANSGKPTYGDVTNDGCLKKRITSTDTDMHWWTIATLYKVAGSDYVFTSDIAHFQIQTVQTKFMLDIFIAINIDNPTTPLEVTTSSSLHPLGYVPFEDDSDIDNLVRPQIRIIWNRNTLQGSGIAIQFGMALKKVAEETLGITDLSGTESCIKLIDAVDSAVTPEDDLVLLPSGNAIWSTDNTDSQVNSHLIPLAHGNVVWAGAYALNRPNADWKKFTLDHFLEDEIDINKLKSVSLLLEENNANKFTVELPLLSKDDVSTGVGSFTYAGKAASVVYRLIRNAVTGKLEMTLEAEVLAGLTANALHLRYVVVNS